MISFASSSPLDEYLQDAATHRDSVMYLPRCADFSGKDKDPRACISFSVEGMPGPYLLDLAEARVIIDGEDDKVFEQFGWRSTKLQIDVCTNVFIIIISSANGTIHLVAWSFYPTGRLKSFQ